MGVGVDAGSMAQVEVEKSSSKEPVVEETCSSKLVMAVEGTCSSKLVGEET